MRFKTSLLPSWVDSHSLAWLLQPFVLRRIEVVSEIFGFCHFSELEAVHLSLDILNDAHVVLVGRLVFQQGF